MHPASDNEVNAPASAWAWLEHRLLLSEDEAPHQLVGGWSQLRSAVNGASPGTSVGDWPSDFWVGRTQRWVGPVLVPVWDIPERIDGWPGLAAESFIDRGLSLAASNGVAFAERLDASVGPGLGQVDPGEVQKLLAQPTTADDAAVREQIFAWLHAAFGAALVGPVIAGLADERSADLLSELIVQRITQAGSLGMHRSFDYGCEYLYNAEVAGRELKGKVLRHGQGGSWQEFWNAVSAPLTTEATAAAVDRASRVLASETLLAGLTHSFEVGDESTRNRALCVTRRWLLTAKLLAWLSDALRHQWTDIRPRDLTCFAFAALSPNWPRPVAAISHRSRDCKPILAQLHMWDSPFVAVDSSFIPAWETNTGMIWSLFASTPLLLRIRSEYYSESIWCRREAEIIDYLADRSDFLEGRLVGDVSVDRLAELDGALFSPGGATASSPPIPLPAPGHSFPVPSPVLMCDFPAPLDLDVLRAAAALRLIASQMADPFMANGVAYQAARDYRRLAIAPPTNNPGGWADYQRVFRALGAREGDGDTQGILPLPILLPHDYGNKDVLLDRWYADRVPDLSDGRLDLMDILAALEWSRTVQRWFIDSGLGDMTCVDVSELTDNDWATAPDISLGRGMLSLRELSPTWIKQEAGQQADLWADFPNYPIFTQYLPGQFSWMLPTYVHPAWRLFYLLNGGFEFSDSLTAQLVSQVVKEAGPEAVKSQETEDGGLRIDVPEALKLFLVPQDVADDILAKYSRDARRQSSGG